MCERSKIHQNLVVTISREFGSGGREIGKRLADELGFAYYDREIIQLLASETGMSDQYINNISEHGIYPYPFQFAKTFTLFSQIQKEQTELLVAEQRIIKEIAKKGNCIIIGRGADTILKEGNLFKIFVYADMQSKIMRCREKRNDEKMTDRELEDKIQKIDKGRKNLRSMISGKEWGDKENYDLCINTTKLMIKNIIKPLSEYIINKGWRSK